jgi:hypothetical protein
MKSTTDLYFAGFLRYQGYKVADFNVLLRDKKNRPIKASFYFEIDEEAWKALKLKFNISEVSQVKQEIEALKDMLY